MRLFGPNKSNINTNRNENAKICPNGNGIMQNNENGNRQIENEMKVNKWFSVCLLNKLKH